MQTMFVKMSVTVVVVAILAMLGLTGTPQAQASQPAQATPAATEAMAAGSAATEAAAATPADAGAFPPCPDVVPQPTPEATVQASGAKPTATKVAPAATAAATPDISGMKVGPFQTLSGCTLQAKLAGNNEVPKKGPAKAHGEAVLVFVRPDTGPGMVCFSIDGVGGVTLPMTAGHIHIGAEGVPGPVVVPLAAPNATSRGQVTGCTSGVDRALINDILTHPYNYYVNLHNAAYPAGAMRGQLEPPPQ